MKDNAENVTGFERLGLAKFVLKNLIVMFHNSRFAHALCTVRFSELLVPVKFKIFTSKSS